MKRGPQTYLKSRGAELTFQKSPGTCHKRPRRFFCARLPCKHINLRTYNITGKKPHYIHEKSPTVYEHTMYSKDKPYTCTPRELYNLSTYKHTRKKPCNLHKNSPTNYEKSPTMHEPAIFTGKTLRIYTKRAQQSVTYNIHEKSLAVYAEKALCEKSFTVYRITIYTRKPQEYKQREV